MVRGLKDYVNNDNNGYLPVTGILPDMTADTHNYINLQNLYRNQANQDVENVYRHITEHLKILKLPFEMIAEKNVKLLCREAAYVTIVRGTQMSDEYKLCPNTNLIASELEMVNTLMEHYIVLRAFDKFFSENTYCPGECHLETDICRVKSYLTKLMTEWGFSIPISDDLAHELCRYGGSELHSVSAFIGNLNFSF